jgi:transcriptional regulator with XRE-family HTH domain
MDGAGGAAVATKTTASTAERIQARAAELGAGSAAELARRLRARGCEVSRQAVGSWLRGESLPSGERLACLLDVLALEGRSRVDLAAAVALSRGST